MPGEGNLEKKRGLLIFDEGKKEEVKGSIGRCGARWFYTRVEALTKHKLVTELSGLGSRAIGKPRGAGGAKESEA